MSENCIIKRDVERLLKSETLTFRHGRITYKNREILFPNKGGKIISTNIDSLDINSEPIYEDIIYPIGVKKIGQNTEITFPTIKLFIKVATTIVPENLEVFSFENLIPLLIDNQSGTVNLQNGSIYTVTKRWTYNYGQTPSIVDENRVLKDLFSTNSSSGPIIEGNSIVNILPESYYDNVYSYFNVEETSNLIKTSSTTWKYTLPKLTVTFGDKPETTYTFFFQSQGLDYININS